MEATNVAAIEWGVASSVLPGQSQSGDRHFVCSFPDGALLGVVDGLGHGDEAAAASAKAVHVIENGAELPITALMQRCHEELKATRGVVISVASVTISRGLMAWIGVGNVQGVLLRAGTQMPQPQEVLLLRGGVLGIHLPPLAAEVLEVLPGDILIFATDGVREEFARGPITADASEEAAKNVLGHFWKGNDDALVLVARFLGNRK